MKKKILTILKYAFFLAIGIALLYYAFRNTNPHQMIQEMREADYFWVGVSVFVSLFAYYSRAARWLILLEPLGHKPKISNSLYSVFFGYFANLAAPRIGELARCTALNQAEEIPLNTLIGTVLLERVIDVVMLFLLLATVFFLNVQMFGNFFMNIFRDKIQPLNNMNFIFIALAAGVFMAVLIFFFRKKIMQISFAGKVKTFLKGVVEGFASIGKMKKKWLFIFHTLVIWLGYVMMTYTGFFALKETAHLSFADGLFITAAGGLGMAAPANGGIGTYHAAVMFGLMAVGVAPVVDVATGVQISNPGLVFATIMHASQVLFILVMGSFSFVMLYLEKNKRQKIKSVTE